VTPVFYTYFDALQHWFATVRWRRSSEAYAVGDVTPQES
jgi:hypothetical protein